MLGLVGPTATEDRQVDLGAVTQLTPVNGGWSAGAMMVRGDLLYYPSKISQNGNNDPVNHLTIFDLGGGTQSSPANVLAAAGGDHGAHAVVLDPAGDRYYIALFGELAAMDVATDLPIDLDGDAGNATTTFGNPTWFVTRHDFLVTPY